MGPEWRFTEQFLPKRTQFRLSSNLQKLFYKSRLLLFSCIGEMTSQTRLRLRLHHECVRQVKLSGIPS